MSVNFTQSEREEVTTFAKIERKRGPRFSGNGMQ